MNLSRRQLLKNLSCGALGALAPAAARARVEESSPPEPLPRLRELAAGRPLIGAAVPNRFENVLSPAAIEILKLQFDSVTPENCMKWTSLCPTEGEYRFDEADRVIQFAQGHAQKAVGHCLIFNRPNNYPAWVFRDGENEGEGEADAKRVWERIESYMTEVMTRYRGKIHSWDVLNEFVEVEPPHYRETDFTRVLGPDYPVRLFKLAAQLDPDALLTYNDFGIEQPERRTRILKFVRSLQDRGCRIDVVGSQSHLEIGRPVGDELSATIREFAALGIKCAFTELDVDVIPRRKYWNLQTREEAIKENPYPDGCPDEILDQQAAVYRDVFAAVMANRDHVDRVTLWGITDQISWLNNWPWTRTNHPLLFDRNANPKPSFHAVAQAISQT